MAKRRNQVLITLSKQVLDDFEAIASHAEIPTATLLRQILEDEWRSIGFSEMLVRAKETNEP